MSKMLSEPFIGPKTFSQDDKGKFFGRDPEAAELLSLVISEPIILFFAQSGAGKSSLVNTKLIPDLKKANFEVLPVGRVGTQTIESHDGIENIFVYNLLQGLSENASREIDLADLSLYEFLRDFEPEESPADDVADSNSQSSVPEEVSEAEPHEVSLDESVVSEQDTLPSRVLIIDQFEEVLYTYPTYWEQRAAFFEQLGNAVQQDPNLWVILVIREDHVAALTPYLHLLPGQLRAHYYMQQLDVKAALLAVETPAERGGRPFAPGIARKLVDELRRVKVVNKAEIAQGEHDAFLSEYIDPVQLQIVCYQLWQNTDGQSEITEEDIKQSGNIEATVDDALMAFYEDALTAAVAENDVDEWTLRNWFEANLVTEAGTRSTVYRGEQETADLKNAVVDLLVEKFLLRAEPRAGNIWYELSHDRFVEPIISSNRAWIANQDQLTQAAQDWNDSGRKDEKLLQGKFLAEAVSTSGKPSDNEIVASFIRASEDFEKEQNKKEYERQKTKEDWLRRAYYFFILISIPLTIITIVLVYNAFVAFQNANKERREAEAVIVNVQATRVPIDATSTSANVQIASAAVESTRAIEAAAAARATTEYASTQQADAATEEVAALMAGYEAATAIVDAEAREAEANIASIRAAENEIIAQTREVEASDQSALLLAQALAFQALNIEDLAYDTELAALLARQAYRLNEEKGGNKNISINTALSFVLNQPYFNTTLRGHIGAVNDIDFAPEGQLLASAGADGTIKLWDLTEESGEPKYELGKVHEGGANVVKFMASNLILTAGNDGFIRLWNIDESYTEPVREIGGVGVVKQVSIDPDLDGENQNELLVSLADGTVKVIYLNDLDAPQTELIQAKDFSGDFRSASFFRNPRVIVVGGNSDGTIAMWPRYEVIPLYSEVHTNHVLDLPEEGSGFVSYVGSYYVNEGKRGSIYGLSDGGIFLIGAPYLDDDEIGDLIVEMLDGHTKAVNSVVYVKDGGVFISGGEDGNVSLWQRPSDFRDKISPIVTFNAQIGAITEVSLSADENVIAAAGIDGIIRLWYANSPLQIVHGGAPIALSDDEQLLASTSDKTVFVQTLAQGQPDIAARKIEFELFDPVTSLTFGPDEPSLFIGGDRREIGILYEWQEGNPTNVIRGYENFDFEVYSLGISGQNEWIAAAGPQSNAIQILAADDFRRVRWPLVGHTSAIKALAFAPDTLVSGSEEAVFLWRFSGSDTAPQGERVGEEGASAVAFSPNGRFFVVGNKDGITLWQTDNLTAPIAAFLEPVSQVKALAFTPDGQAVVAAGKGLRWWDIYQPDGEINPLPPPLILANEQTHYEDLVLTELSIIAATQTETYFWPNPDRLAAEICRLVRRDLTDAEWDKYLFPEKQTATCAKFSKKGTESLQSEIITVVKTPAFSQFLQFNLVSFLLLIGLVQGKKWQKRKKG